MHLPVLIIDRTRKKISTVIYRRLEQHSQPKIPTSYLCHFTKQLQILYCFQLYRRHSTKQKILWVTKQVSIMVKIKLNSCKIYSLNTTEFNQNRKISGKFSSVGKLSNTLQNTKKVKEEITSEIGLHFELNGNVNAT